MTLDEKIQILVKIESGKSQAQVLGQVNCFINNPIHLEN